MLELNLNQQLMGFDFGTRHIGVAIGQLITQTATPLQTIKNRNGIPDWDAINNLHRQWDLQAFIVGVPLNMDGSDQNITVLARQFIQDLGRRFPIPVYPVDERLSTVAAKTELFERGGYKALSKNNIDNNAAKLLLEQWMRGQNTPI